ncbi:ABC transporter ATP-binding protein [Erwinia sp. 9145]|uniref:metal ABC transporter ATP-binding protein n=1 Tax=Erwinia sp. 9145 TaxID=1500895 RepID=UPI00068F303C|nr:ABC transporter ATP-binding protein [Erwinia sp. 9145]
MIRLKNLTVGYQGVAVTSALNGEFKHGSMTALTGANGSGKSTLIKTLAGLQRPVSGEIAFSDPLPSIAWLPQQSDIEKNFPVSVFDVVAMGCWQQSGWFKGIGRQQRQAVMHALEQAGVQNLAHARPGTLSGGQLQRVMFARLLMQQAELLLLDEPFAGIDSATTGQLLALLEALNRAGRTLIVVLHDMSTVEKYFPQTLHLAERPATACDSTCGRVPEAG